MASSSKKAALAVDEDFVKSRMVTADRVYHRLLWDDRIPVADFDLGYEDRFKGILFLPITRFRHTGDETSEIPFHRVHLFRYKGEIIWDRDNRIDRIDKFFERFGTTTSDDDAATASSLLRSTMSGTADGVRIRRPHKNRDKALAEEEEESEEEEDERNDDGVEDATEMKVVTFNVLFDRFQADKIYTDWRIPLVARELERQDADLIGLQEVTDDFYNKLRRASDGLRNGYYWTSVPNDVPSCQVILSRYPLTECVSLSLSKNKRAIFAVVEVKSVPIVVCNCHLVSDHAGGSAMAVGRRVEELKTILARLSPYPSCVLLGDFNFGDQSPEIRSVPLAPFVDTYLETRHGIVDKGERETHTGNHTTGVSITDDDTNPEAVAIREKRSVGGYTYDVVHNDLALLCSQFHVYPRRLDRILVKGLQPLSTSLFGQAPTRIMVPVRLPKTAHAEEGTKKHGRGGGCAKTEKQRPGKDEENGAEEPYTPPPVKGPTKEVLLFPSDHYGVSCTVVFNTAALAAAASVSVQLPLPPTSFPPFVPCFQTALCIVPPDGLLHDKINAIREVYDRGYPRWMPHINVMHPFVAPDRMPDAIELVESVLASSAVASLPLVTVSLNQLSFFEARKRLVFLLPECDDGGEKLSTLQRLLQESFPHCRKEKVDEQGYHPHLTLGQVDGKGQFAALERLFDETWERPTTFALTELCMVGLLEGADKYVVLHRFAVDTTGTGATAEEHGPAREQCLSSAARFTAMVMEAPAWGTRALRPYTPEDALERWMLCVTNPVYAREAPTHISQRGAMYHIPSHLIDAYLTEWAKSYEASSDETEGERIPFYMEEIRGSVFRLYVDLDIKSTRNERIDATEIIPFIASVAAEVFHLKSDGDDGDDTQLLSMQCHGPWTDQLHPDAKFKSGYRLYFQRVFVDSPTLGRFLEILRHRLQANPLGRSILMNETTTPHGMQWEEMCDAKAAAWDRGRLVGTIKRRRNLQRRYTFHGLFSSRGQVRADLLVGDLRRILYGTTLRVWETVPTGNVATDNAFHLTRFKTLA